ncbi:MAG: epoxyqueuosine reductase [Clostridia bacterium]|nr:epoxyqueuosine reductase [Clostridia bacterium]
MDSYYQASNAAYHAARTLESSVLDAGCFAKGNVSYPAKEAAIRARMGRIGLNSLLITPKYGSRVVIILMVTGIEIPQAPVGYAPQTCLECGKCAKACPSGALGERGMSHPERCLRNFMMEGVVVPDELRAKIGMRLIGCDICQRVCPLQSNAPEKREEPYLLRSFITEDAAAFSSAVSKLAEEIGRNAARPQRVRAQAALLAGNAKDKTYLPVLYQWAQSPFEAVREHALWAIKQIEFAGDNT